MRRPCLTLRFHAAAGATNGPNVVPYSWSWRLPLTLSQTYQLTYLVLVLITLNQLTPLVCFTSFVLVSFPYFTYLLLVRLTNSPTDSSHSSSQRLLLRPSQPFSCTPLVCLFYRVSQKKVSDKIFPRRLPNVDYGPTFSLTVKHP